jgi:hypothetical protein
LKLPLLVEHFNQHQKENKNITIFSFLEIHYTQGSPKDADYDQDMKLPFKTFNNCNFTNISNCCTLPYQAKLQNIYFIKKNNNLRDYSFLYSSASLNTIWQPPKAC